MDALRIELAGGFSLRQGHLERMLRELQPLSELKTETRVEVDLSRLATMSPAALALLTGSLHRVAARGVVADGSEVIPPGSPSARTYVQRMNLLKPLLDFARIEQYATTVTAQDPRGCLPFAGPDDYSRVAGELTNALCEHCGADPPAAAAVRICLDEIAENVVHHARAPAGFAAAQGWASNEFEVAIVDLGVGIRSSLLRNELYGDIEDDATAIATALKPQVTSTPSRNSGIGLFVTRMVLRSNGGSLLVRSGTGAVYSGGEERTESSEVEMPGTLVALRARTDRPFDMDSVYAHLPPIDDI